MYFLKTKKWTPNGPKTNEHISLTYYIRVLSPNFIEMWSSVHQSIVPIWTRPHYSLMKKKINEKVGQNYGHQYQKSLLSINVGVYNFPRIQRSLARNHFFFLKNITNLFLFFPNYITSHYNFRGAITVGNLLLNK